MRTVAIFKNGNNQAVRLPSDMAYEGIEKLEIRRSGDTITLRPPRPSWLSFSAQPKADPDFLGDRSDIIHDDNRFEL